MTLADIQSEFDHRGIGVDEVGISSLRYPVSVFDRVQGKQDTIADVSVSVALPPDQRGTHLSRLVEVLDAHAGELTPQSIPGVLQALKTRLEVHNARLHMEFPYFIRRQAPISGSSAFVDYTCGFSAAVRGEEVALSIIAHVPVTSVCPCSKAISDYGAHNQRGTLTIRARSANNVEAGVEALWMEDLIVAAEASASSPVYPLLKRIDERHVTMAAYDRPVFVEDMVRGVAERLRLDSRIIWFSVEAVNDESIHNHNAFARLAWPEGEEALPW